MRKIRRCLDLNKNNKLSKFVGCCAEREIYSKKTNLIFYLKKLYKEQIN